MVGCFPQMMGLRCYSDSFLHYYHPCVMTRDLISLHCHFNLVRQAALRRLALVALKLSSPLLVSLTSKETEQQSVQLAGYYHNGVRCNSSSVSEWLTMLASRTYTFLSSAYAGLLVCIAIWICCMWEIECAGSLKHKGPHLSSEYSLHVAIIIRCAGKPELMH